MASKKTLLAASVNAQKALEVGHEISMVRPPTRLERIADWVSGDKELSPEEQKYLESISSNKNRSAILKAATGIEAAKRLARILRTIEDVETALSGKDLDAVESKDLIRLLSVLYGAMGSLRGLIDNEEPEIQVNILNQQQNHLNLPPSSREKIRRLIEQNLKGEPR